MDKISINIDLCNNCGICVQSCPLKVFVQTDKSQAPEIVDGICYNCGHCVAICPEKAINHKVVLPELIMPVKSENKPSYEQVIEMIRSRRSIRVFEDKPVDKKDIEKVIQGAAQAPSGMNSQSTEFIAIQDKDIQKKIVKFSYQFLKRGVKILRHPLGKMLMRASIGRNAVSQAMPHLDRFEYSFIKPYENGNDRILHNAPWLLLFHTNAAASGADINATLAVQNANYVCEGLNLGSLNLGLILSAAQNEKKINKLLSLPKNHKIYGVLAIGYPKYKYNNWIQRRPRIIWS